jgi:hypothetical protein
LCFAESSDIFLSGNTGITVIAQRMNNEKMNRNDGMKEA